MITWQRWILVAMLAAASGCDGCDSKKTSPVPAQPGPAGTGNPTAARAPSKPTAEAKPVAPADEKRWVEGVTLAEDFAKLVKANADDCGKLAAAIEKWTADNRDAIAKEQTLNDDLGADTKDTLRDRYKERVDKADKAAEEALEKCESHPGVKKAMEALPNDD